MLVFLSFLQHSFNELNGLTSNWPIKLGQSKFSFAYIISEKDKTKVYQLGSNSITGVYETAKEDSGSCPIKIIIKRQKTQYYYQIITNRRNKKGKVLLDKSDAQYITFKGLPADENNGDLQGILSNHEILIQNTGNAMNQYTRLSECDKKYIRLVKIR